MGLGSPITRGPFGAAGWVGSIVRRMDWLAVIAIGLLMFCGLGMSWINARSYGQELLDPSSIFLRSIVWISLSVVVFSVVTAINWRWIRTFAWPLYGANILLLIATLFFGDDSGGNSRAIALFGIAIQSSEIAKILTLVALATVLTRESAEAETLSNTLLGSRTTYTITPLMFVSALVQYNSSTNTVSANVRLRWEYQPGSELFVVYNDERDTRLSGFPGLMTRSFIVKVNRLFRF